MRYADRITFIKQSESYYDPEKGEYVDGEEKPDTVPCNLSPVSVDRTNELFGSIEQNITVARLQKRYDKPYDRVEINKKPYSVRSHIRHRRKSVFYLEGS